MKKITILVLAVLALASTSCVTPDYERTTVDLGSDCVNSYPNACRILQMRCRAENSESCYWLGLAYQQPYFVNVQNLDRAQKLFTRACRLGNASGCKHLNH